MAKNDQNWPDLAKKMSFEQKKLFFFTFGHRAEGLSNFGWGGPKKEKKMKNKQKKFDIFWSRPKWPKMVGTGRIWQKKWVLSKNFFLCHGLQDNTKTTWRISMAPPKMSKNNENEPKINRASNGRRDLAILAEGAQKMAQKTFFYKKYSKKI